MPTAIAAHGRLVIVAVFGLIIAGLAAPAQAAPKPKPPPKPPEPQFPVPTDVNDLSMRVSALETIYEFDLSDAQLRALRTLAVGAGQKDARTPAKAGLKIVQALKDLHTALLKADDDDKIGDLKDTVDELKDDDEVDLDDDIDVTDAARAKTPAFVKQLKASQIAAYLAVHAEEVSDPAEQMIDSLNDLRTGESDDPDGDAQDSADDIAHLVAGLDSAKAEEVSAKVLEWFKANRDLKDEQFEAKNAALEESAHKIVGEIPAMTVLSHWLDYEAATLLSNPQLIGAIDATLTARAQRK
jgi:hypothetical protein